MLKKRGILTIAVKHPYYGRMAYNLAATVKAADPDFLFAVIADTSGLAHLTSDQRDIFDIVIDHEAVAHPVALKLLAYDLTPFEETILVDADTFWLPSNPPGKLIDELPEDCLFTGITEAWVDFTTGGEIKSKRYTYWAEVDHIRQEYKLTEGKMYQWRSEVLFFRKNKQTKKLFDLAKKIYTEPKVGYLKFVNGVPDELAFNIAAAKLNVNPHVFRWNPSYWINLYGSRIPLMNELIANGYYLISCGSAGASSTLKNTYNRIVKYSMNKLGRQHVFSLIPKREFIKDRKTQ